MPVNEYKLPRPHDWANHDACECGNPGCGSYRPLGPDTPSMREMIAQERARNEGQ